MCLLCRKNIISNKDLNRKVIKLVHKIEHQFNPSKIILFGSLSQGRSHELSDLELIIVGQFNVPFFKRIGLILNLNDTDLEVDPLVYTEEEFARMLDEDNFFIINAIKEGTEIQE